jgi:dTDP-4-dehydrorhamnose 3,5-epimerase
MRLKFIPTSLPDIILIEPAVFTDHRGFFMETFHHNKYTEAGIIFNSVQDNRSHSIQGALRGLHYQLKHSQAKLIYVISGEIFDVAVDIRLGSPTFGQWAGAVLSEKNNHQIYIPKGFAHGFCVLSESADIIYKCSELYTPGDEYGILWSDPDINIKWPATDPILSVKDKQNPCLTDVNKEFLPIYTL